ncbi:hypothetical protein JOF53_008030 [Crossiella equi]|uniref:A-factor biosynthesis hotdog domain-containing protein n=1 Tax=Crossiella equi TaxID=130796 RepID=A0ABS5ARG1_9PSEU|nr:AfsA-related hotdog domain-containing protein [Crossiella equi]MBP2479158.1 hypothetical protein [Crossiella equi]
MHKEQVIFVIGDRLYGGPPRPDVIGLSELLRELRLGAHRDEDVRFVPAQGIGAQERDLLRAELALHGLSTHRLADPETPGLAGRPEVHKHNPDNILLAGFRVGGPGVYEATLRLSNRNELLLDHTTGTHLSGMVLIEAIRQMTLAVGEHLYPEEVGHRGPTRFIINSQSTRFTRFLLPLRTDLVYRLDTVTRKRETGLLFAGTCEFTQAGEVGAVGSMEMLILPTETAEHLETRAADKTMAALRGRFTPAAAVDGAAR